MKQTYVPTEADRLTGEKLRRLRHFHGETMQQTIDASGVKMKQSTYSRVELGQRALSLPDATKLAAHWNTTTDAILAKSAAADVKALIGDAWPKTMKPAVETEQQFLGNERPTLFAVPDHQQQILGELAAAAEDPRTLRINLDAPLSPAEYHAQVWVPFLEARYAADKTA